VQTNPIGDFKIIREIGRGGMGVVYEAVQMSLARRVALKVLPFAATLDSRHLQPFHQEAQAAAQLHHTNIVPVYAVGCERGVHFYAMQLIEGQALDAVIRQVRQGAGRPDLSFSAMMVLLVSWRSIIGNPQISCNEPLEYHFHVGGCMPGEDVTPDLSPHGLPKPPGVRKLWPAVAAIASCSLVAAGTVVVLDQLLLARSASDREEAQRAALGHVCRFPIRPPDYTAIAVADYDGDGLMDLYVTRAGPPKIGSWLTGKSGDPQGNTLFRNRGEWRFEDVTKSAGVDGGQRSSFTAVWLDPDNDGKPDLYAINEFGDGVLYHNQGRQGVGPVTFRERRLAPPPCDVGAMGVVAGDIDNDGRIDIYSADMYSKAGKRVIGNLKNGTYPDEIMARMRTFVTGSQLHRNLGDLRFEQVGQAWQVHDCGWAYGPALADLDNDGFLDLFATCGFMSRTRDEPDG
jgi:hypothetical protein